jgi:hypothetical protein
MMHAISLFLLGVGASTFAGAGIFFIKFWRASRDHFFLYFAAAFWILALERALDVFVSGTQESLMHAAVEAASWVYLVRLAAFALILVAMVDRNRAGKA